jgi:AFG3 family protein
LFCHSFFSLFLNISGYLKLFFFKVRKHIAEAYTRTENLLKEKKEPLERVAKWLLRQEILNADDLEEILGKRPWGKKSTYDELTGDVHPPPEVTVETAPPPPSSSSPSVA